MWLNDSNCDTVNIPGYRFVFVNHKNTIGDGVGLYLRNDLDFKILSERCFTDANNFESIFVEVNIPSAKNIYRPPWENVIEILESFQNMLSIVTQQNKLIYVVGEWNLDLLAHDRHSATDEFINLMYSHMLYPLITYKTDFPQHNTN